MDLLIFEKKTQAEMVCDHFSHRKSGQSIQIYPDKTYFPKGATAVWASGHLLALKEPGEYKDEWKKWSVEQLPMTPDVFKKKITKGKSKAYNNIKTHVQDDRFHRIINCGDFGVEGQLIVDEILMFAQNKKPVMRLWANSLGKQAIKKALKEMKPNEHYQSILNAATTREQIDWLIGMNSSRLVTTLVNIYAQKQGVLSKSSYTDTFSVGRVQTSLLKLIVDRDYVITHFKKQAFWDVLIDINLHGNSFQAKWKTDQHEHFFDKDEADMFSSFLKEPHTKGEVIDCTFSEERKEPPQLYNLTDLQRDADRYYQMSNKDTLACAQELYLKSYITYPRAEPRVVSTDEASMFPDILNAIEQHWSGFESQFPISEESVTNVQQNKRYVNDGGVDDHHAIIPTETIPKASDLSDDERRIYDLIIRRFISIYLPPLLKETVILKTVVDQQFPFTLKDTGIVDLGWKALYSKDTESFRQLDKEKLRLISNGDTFDIDDVLLKEGSTKPPARFSFGQLSTVMENAARYLEGPEKEKCANAELSLGTVATRANIIETLKAMNYIRVQKNKVYPTEKGKLLIQLLDGNWITEVYTTGRLEQALASIQEGQSSKENILEAIHKLIHKLVTDLPKQMTETWDINAQMIQSLEKKQTATPKSLGKCLKCETGNVVDKKTFYGCTNYHDTGCSFKISKEIAKKKITSSLVKQLLENKQTDLIEGFYSKKKDKNFSAVLKWNEQKQMIQFTFE